MINDTSIASLFAYAKQPSANPNSDFPTHPVVYATWVEHLAALHPGASPETDRVFYCHGPLELSADKKSLHGEFKEWNNNFHEAATPFDGNLPDQDDAFVYSDNKRTRALTISANGVATMQVSLDGKPVDGLPPTTMNAKYAGGIMVEQNSSKSTTGGAYVQLLSFAFGNGNGLT